MRKVPPNTHRSTKGRNSTSAQQDARQRSTKIPIGTDTRHAFGRSPNPSPFLFIRSFWGSVRSYGYFQECSARGDILGKTSAAKTASLISRISKRISIDSIAIITNTTSTTSAVSPASTPEGQTILSAIALVTGIVLAFAVFPLPRQKSARRYVFFAGLVFLGLVFLGSAYLFTLLFLVNASLIDYQLFVTLVLAEVPIAIFLHYILGEGKGQRLKKLPKLSKESMLSKNCLILKLVS